MSLIKVPSEVAVGLQAVRDSGTTNLVDVPVVCLQAVALGYPEAADWIEKNASAYLEGIFRGFEEAQQQSESGEQYDKKQPIWSFRPTTENLEWLEEERWENEDGTPESNAALLNRKLAKLRKLEQQGF